MTTEPSTSAPDVAALVELLEQQCQLYAQLATVSGQQTGVIADDFGTNTGATDEACEQLLRLLAQRQVLIDQIAAVDGQLAPYRADWQSLWQSFSAEERCRVGPLVNQVERTLAEIIDQDDLDRQRLERARGAAGHELTRLSAAGAAVNAYKAAPTTADVNRFTNQQA